MKKRIPLDEPGYRKPRKANDIDLTIRLIESIHAIALVLGDHDLRHQKVKEAISDLFENSPINKLTSVFVDERCRKDKHIIDL